MAPGRGPERQRVVLGNFNEGQPIGSEQQSLAVLFKAEPPMIDAFSLLPNGRSSTHADKHAYDRFLVPDGIAKGLSGLKLERVEIVAHRHGRGEERRLYTDHFPVIATFAFGH